MTEPLRLAIFDVDGTLGASQHRIRGMLVTMQVADDHPSKPHPAMIEAALCKTATAAQCGVMIGDATYDMGMACNAGVSAIGAHATDFANLDGLPPSPGEAA